MSKAILEGGVDFRTLTYSMIDLVYCFRNEKAAEMYKKITYGSSYTRFYGDFPQLNRGDCEILSHKLFKDLKLASVLNPMALQYLNNWALMKDDDYYVNLMMTSMRSIYTFIKNLAPKISRYTESHFWAPKHDLIEPSRFDTIEKAIKKEAHMNTINSNYKKSTCEGTLLRADKRHSSSQPSIGITPFEIR